MHCIKCLTSGNVYTLYNFFKNKNFYSECFNEEECEERRQQLTEKDFEVFFEENYGWNIKDLIPLPYLSNKKMQNEYFYNLKTKKFFVHYDALITEEPMEVKLKKTLKSYFDYPISLGEDVKEYEDYFGEKKRKYYTIEEINEED